MSNDRWLCITNTVIGDSHIRKSVANQDAIKQTLIPGNCPMQVLAIADGHGSEHCFRSDIGSQFAIDVAIEMLTEYCQSINRRGIEFYGQKKSSILINSSLTNVRKNLIPTLIKSWKEKVETHLASNPIAENFKVDDPFLLYGTTLVAVVMSDQFAMFLQLGDGDILTVSEDSIVDHLFVGASAKIGDETNSLCMVDAATLFEVEIRFFDQDFEIPRTVLACTDGFSNAFKSEDSFRRAGVDFSTFLRTNEGVANVKESLEMWLREYSNYSGDDVSVGLIYRTD